VLAVSPSWPGYYYERMTLYRESRHRLSLKGRSPSKASKHPCGDSIEAPTVVWVRGLNGNGRGKVSIRQERPRPKLGTKAGGKLEAPLAFTAHCGPMTANRK
jgi:hypothetical protein